MKYELKTVSQARTEKLLTQEALAELLGISQVSMSNIETGKHFPRKKTREKIEMILGPIDWKAQRRKYLKMQLLIIN